MRYVLAWVGAVLLGGCGLPLGSSSSNNGTKTDGGAGGGGGTGGTGASCAWAGPVEIDKVPYGRANISIHVVGNDRIVVNDSGALRELDCSSWSLVEISGLEDLQSSSHAYQLSDHGLVFIGTNGVHFVSPDLKIERLVPYPAGIDGSPTHVAVDGQDNVWMLGTPPDCATNAILGVVTRAGGSSASPLADSGVLLTNRTDCSTTPNYQVSIQGTQQGGLLLFDGGSTGGVHTSQTLPRTLFERCQQICERFVFGAEQCTDPAGFTNATHCPGICQGAWAQSTIDCLWAAADCAEASNCTIEPRGEVLKVLAVATMSTTSAGVIAVGPAKYLSSARYDFDTGSAIWDRGGFMRGLAVETHSGLLTWNSFWKSANSGLPYRYGRFEAWDPATGELLWHSTPIQVRAYSLQVNSVLEGTQRLFAQVFADKADIIVSVSETVALTHVERTQSDGALRALPSVLVAERAVRELSDGGFLAGVRDGDRLLLQRFDALGQPVAGTSGAGTKPICDGSRSFTGHGEPCYLASTSTPNQYQCTSDSTYRYSYRCNPSTCLFEGERCLPCEAGCSPCAIGICN